MQNKFMLYFFLLLLICCLSLLCFHDLCSAKIDSNDIEDMKRSFFESMSALNSGNTDLSIQYFSRNFQNDPAAINIQNSFICYYAGIVRHWTLVHWRETNINRTISAYCVPDPINRFQSPNRFSVYADVEFINEDGQWKINDIRFHQR